MNRRELLLNDRVLRKFWVCSEKNTNKLKEAVPLDKDSVPGNATAHCSLSGN